MICEEVKDRRKEKEEKDTKLFDVIERSLHCGGVAGKCQRADGRRCISKAKLSREASMAIRSLLYNYDAFCSCAAHLESYKGVRVYE